MCRRLSHEVGEHEKKKEDEVSWKVVESHAIHSVPWFVLVATDKEHSNQKIDEDNYLQTNTSVVNKERSNENISSSMENKQWKNDDIVLISPQR